MSHRVDRAPDPEATRREVGALLRSANSSISAATPLIDLAETTRSRGEYERVKTEAARLLDAAKRDRANARGSASDLPEVQGEIEGCETALTAATARLAEIVVRRDASIADWMASQPTRQSSSMTMRQLLVDRMPDLEPGPRAPDGEALPGGLKNELEATARENLDDVRLRDDAEANEVADSHDARAVALGSTIHFATGELNASSTEGQHLIAHETAHTVQADGAASTPAPKSRTTASGDPVEREADHFADAFSRGERSAPLVERLDGGVAARTPAGASSVTPLPVDPQQQQQAAEMKKAEARLSGIHNTLQIFRSGVDAVDADLAFVASRKVWKDYSETRSSVLMLKTNAELAAASDGAPSAADAATLTRLVAMLGQVEMTLCLQAAPVTFRGQAVPGLAPKPAASDVEEYVQREMLRTVFLISEATEILTHLAAADENEEPPQRLVDRVEVASAQRTDYLFLVHVLRESGGGRLLSAKGRDGKSLEVKAEAVQRSVPQRAEDITSTLEEAQACARSRDLTTAGALVRLARERARELGDQSALDRVLRGGSADGFDMGLNLEIASRATAEIDSLATAVGRGMADSPNLFTLAINASRAAIPVFQLVSGEREAQQSAFAGAGEAAENSMKGAALTFAVVASAGLAIEAAGPAIMYEVSLAAHAARTAWAGIGTWALANPEAKMAVIELAAALGLEIAEGGVDQFIERLKTPEGAFQILMDVLVVRQSVHADAPGPATSRARREPSGTGSIRAQLDDAVDLIRAKGRAILDVPIAEPAGATTTGHTAGVDGGTYKERLDAATAENLNVYRKERAAAGGYSHRPTPGQRMASYIPPEPGKQPFELRKQLMAEAKEQWPVGKAMTDEDRARQWEHQVAYFDIVEQNAKDATKRLERAKAKAPPDEREGIEAEIAEAKLWIEATKIKPVAGKLPLNAEYAGELCGFDDIRRNNPNDAVVAEQAIAELKRRGMTGIKFKETGYPDLDPLVFESNGIEARVDINMSRARGTDFDRANSMMRQLDPEWEQPPGWTWHHHEKAGVMVLVPESIHAVVSHTGGVATNKHQTGDEDAYR